MVYASPTDSTQTCHCMRSPSRRMRASFRWSCRVSLVKRVDASRCCSCSHDGSKPLCRRCRHAEKQSKTTKSGDRAWRERGLRSCNAAHPRLGASATATKVERFFRTQQANTHSLNACRYNTRPLSRQQKSNVKSKCGTPRKRRGAAKARTEHTHTVRCNSARRCFASATSALSLSASFAAAARCLSALWCSATFSLRCSVQFKR